MKLPTWLLDALESDESRWNNGICKASGQPWFYVRSRGFRGRSTTTITNIYEDGCGNMLFLDIFSKLNEEYKRLRTPEIKAKERAALERLAAEDFERKIRSPYVRCFDEDGKEIPYTPPAELPPKKGETFWGWLIWLLFVSLVVLAVLPWKGCSRL